jgi:predicted DNA-binding transcriptional regulator YafY
MKRTKSQYARLIELDRKIRGGGYPNCLTFSGDWGVSQKTVQRDIDFLRDQCGAPVAYDRDRKGFFYEDLSWWLPSVSLSEGELLGVLLAARVAEQYQGSPVARQIERVFEKLASLLPDKVSINPALLYSKFTFTSPPAKPVNEEVWTTVVRGLLARRTISIRYRTFDATDGQEKESLVDPYHIANLQGEWYLFGVHHGHTDVRQFSMARIGKAAMTERHFDMPSGFDPAKLLDGTFARYAGDGEVQTVRLLFDKEIAHWITERQWHPKQKLHRRKTGGIELEFPVKGLFEVQRWVLSWGHSVKVLGPSELKSAVAEEIRMMAKDV